MQLNHLHLHVRDIPASQAFYEKYFGLRVKVQHGPVMFLTDGVDFDLALAPDPDPVPFPSWFHFGFRLPTPEAVRKLHERLLDADIHMIEPLTEDSHLVTFRCEDPDGYAIEVYWEEPVGPSMS